MDADREVARRAEARHGVVRRRDVLDAGLSRSTMRRRAGAGRLVECRPRVFRAAGAPVTWRSELLAAVDWAGDDALASHRSVAAL